MILEATQSVPLTLWKDGSIRVRDTRLLIDMIVDAYNQGESPEEIFEAFPSNDYSIGDIYAVIAYYLSHRVKIDKHLAERSRKAEKVLVEIELDHNIRRELLP